MHRFILGLLLLQCACDSASFQPGESYFFERSDDRTNASTQTADVINGDAKSPPNISSKSSGETEELDPELDELERKFGPSQELRFTVDGGYSRLHGWHSLVSGSPVIIAWGDESQSSAVNGGSASIHNYDESAIYSGTARSFKIASLHMSGANLIDIDFDDLTYLRSIQVYGNKLREVNTTFNVDLERLQVYENAQLDTIDVSSNAKLKELSCYSTNIADLDLSNNPELTSLEVSRSPRLNTLDLRDNPKMSRLLAQSMGLRDLKLSAQGQWSGSIWLNNNDLPASVIDAILIALDASGAKNTSGSLRYDGQSTDGHLDANRSAAAATALANLRERGWSITGYY